MEEKRKYALKKLGEQCQKCATINKPLQVHHKHYKTLYHEKLKDIAILCEECQQVADKQRKQNTIQNICDSAFDIWATKKYGEECFEMDKMILYEEFDKWLEWKEQEDY